MSTPSLITKCSARIDVDQLNSMHRLSYLISIGWDVPGGPLQLCRSYWHGIVEGKYVNLPCAERALNARKVEEDFEALNL
jgi:hypothetical protein